MGGFVSTEETYQHYFHHFTLAQKSRRVVEPSDALKIKTKWNYEEFLHAQVAKDIPQVQEFQRKLKQYSNPQQQRGGYNNYNNPQYGAAAAARGGTQPGVDAECCVIL